MGVEGDGHVEQDLALLYPPHKVLDAVLELVGGLVDLLRVTLAGLSQLLRRLQELIRVGVSVLSHTRTHKRSKLQHKHIEHTLHIHYTRTCHLVFTDTQGAA